MKHHFRPHLARPGDCYDCGDGEADHLPALSPYDPKPNPLTKATNGWIFCPDCEQVVELPHRCTGIAPESPETARPATNGVETAKARAEFAESLLMACAFDHQRRDVKEFYYCEREGICAFCEDMKRHEAAR